MSQRIQAFIRLNKWLARISLYRSAHSDMYRSTHYQMKKIWEELSESERNVIRNYYD
jgi:hypothetical protein